jgi:hypothetical protein
MTKQALIERMKFLAEEMQELTEEFDPKSPEPVFVDDPLVTIEGGNGGGGYPKFSTVTDPQAVDPLQKRWLGISTQLAKKITNPHVNRGDINAIFNGIGKLGELYIEKFKSDDV